MDYRALRSSSKLKLASDYHALRSSSQLKLASRRILAATHLHAVSKGLLLGGKQMVQTRTGFTAFTLGGHWVRRLADTQSPQRPLNADAHLKSWPGFMCAPLRDKAVVVYLSDFLLNESITDVHSRVPVYVAALRVVHANCEVPNLRVLATDPPDLSSINSDDANDKPDDAAANDNAAAPNGSAGGAANSS